MIHFVFYKTSDVFRAEELLNEANIINSIVPTPVQDKAYCGVCVRINSDSVERAKMLLNELEYKQIG